MVTSSETVFAVLVCLLSSAAKMIQKYIFSLAIYQSWLYFCVCGHFSKNDVIPKRFFGQYIIQHYSPVLQNSWLTPIHKKMIMAAIDDQPVYSLLAKVSDMRRKKYMF